MSVNNPFYFVHYFASVFFAMCLRIAAWPDWITTINPDWVLLVLIYWTLANPERIGIFNAWFIGLLVDALTGRMLGMHALTYSLSVFLCLKLHKRLRQYPLLQQGSFIFFCLFISHGFELWFENAQTIEHFQVHLWLPILIGTLCWPIVYTFIRFFRFYGRLR